MSVLISRNTGRKDLKSANCSEVFTSMFIAAQFTTAKLWNQPRCPSINDAVQIHNGILVIKKNEIMAFAGKWMKLEIIMINEISQIPKVKG